MTERPAFGNLRPGNDPSLLEVINVDGNGLRALTEGLNPAWSRDGAFVAFIRDGGLYGMKTDGQGIHEIKATAGFKLTSVSWGP